MSILTIASAAICVSCVLICILGPMLQLLLADLLFKARSGAKIGPDFLVSRVLKSPEKVLIFYPDI